MKKNNTIKSVLALTMVCIFGALVLGGGNLLTADRIAEQKVRIFNEKLDLVFPVADNFDETNEYIIAYKNTKIIGYIVEVENQGYSSIVKLLVGMDFNKQITGVRITDHAETPGLGANADKPGFYDQFKGIRSPDIIEIDSITGATITTDAIKEALIIATKQLEELVDGR